MIPRIQALAENPDIPAGTRAPMIEAFEKYRLDLSAREYVEDYLDAAERHMDTHASLQRVAGSLGVPIVQVSDLPGLETGSGPPEGSSRDHPRGPRNVWRPSLTIWKPAERAWKGNCHGCTASSGTMANMSPKPRHRNRMARHAETRAEAEQPEPAAPAWYASLTEPCGRTGTPSSKTPGKPVSHHSTPTATWT